MTRLVNAAEWTAFGILRLYLLPVVFVFWLFGEEAEPDLEVVYDDR